jgi:coproporphyrinogen III oxidase
MSSPNAVIPARSPRAAQALRLVEDLQSRFKKSLAFAGVDGRFAAETWLRDGGRHGGGTRQAYGGGAFFNRASLNVSQVHYDDQPERPLGSATALSAIVHPAHPRLPSIHLHISWTEMKAGAGYWRIMADLNPSIPDDADRDRFVTALKDASGKLAADALAQGDRYFAIPALGRHRGVAHFYLEQYRTENEEADRELARAFGEKMIDVYTQILAAKAPTLAPPTADECRVQRAYHTVYLFQVLTLDRGTTSGLLVHDQNDVGILGSLPAAVDRGLLASWERRVPSPQDALVRAIVAAIPEDGRIEDAQKLALCRVLRDHYAKHPAALDLQARGDVLPPTVANHTAAEGNP